MEINKYLNIEKVNGTKREIEKKSSKERERKNEKEELKGKS